MMVPADFKANPTRCHVCDHVIYHMWSQHELVRHVCGCPNDRKPDLPEGILVPDDSGCLFTHHTHNLAKDSELPIR